MCFLLQINITRSYKLSTKIIHTKMTNTSQLETSNSSKNSFTMMILKKVP